MEGKKSIPQIMIFSGSIMTNRRLNNHPIYLFNKWSMDNPDIPSKIIHCEVDIEHALMVLVVQYWVDGHEEVK